MKKIATSLSWLLFLYIGNLSSQQKIDGIAAVVGNEIILDSEVSETMMNKSMKGIKTEDRCKELEKMLSNNMLLYHAKKDTAITKTVIDAQVQREVEDILDDFIRHSGNQETLLKQYGRNTIGEIREELTEVLKNKGYTRGYYQILTKNIDISPKEVNSYYDKNKNQLPTVPEEVELAHLVFYPKLTDTHHKQVIDELRSMKKEIENGISFATKAIAYSEDLASAVEGGLIKGIKRGQMVKEFEGVAFALEGDKISDPFETEYGFHIVQLDKRRGEELDLRHILIKPKYTEEEIKRVKVLADSVKSMIIEGKISFGEAAKKYSEDKKTQFNGGLMINPNTKYEDTRFEKDKLPVKLSVALAGIKEGQLTSFYDEEINEKQAYFIVKLLRIIPSHQLSFKDDYQRLKRFTEAQKTSEKLKTWINTHIQDVFIKISQDYQSCSFENNWMKK
ncbi:MAG: peptidylprolyl isomerase [Flavobacteriales bacterium Tduv]